MKDIRTDRTIRLHPECVTCMLNKQIRGIPEQAPESIRLAFIQQVLRVLSEADPAGGAPEILPVFDHLQREYFGKSTDYSDIRRHFNALMLSFAEETEQVIRSSADPLHAAAAYAMTGNFIDFGALESVSEEKLGALLTDAAIIDFPKNVWMRFKEELQSARTLLYITDNCGEIVMDKLFIREMRRANPALSVTVLVKGAPALNDATREDAGQVRMEEDAAVADTGCGFCGVPLSRIPEETRRLLDSADLILAKGQANYETMHGCGRDVYYLFMCKCEFFAERFGVKRFGGVFIRE